MTFKNIKLVYLISLILAIIPFFWAKPGELSIGGDGGRLYFYDPGNILKNLVLYNTLPFGTGVVDAQSYYLPFVSLLILLKYIFHSSYFLIAFHNSIKIVVGFLAVYGIVKELTRQREDKTWRELVRESAAILTGIFYLFTPAMMENYPNALPSHDQVFLNPLLFYLILRFFLTAKKRYLWITLGVTVLFAHNFSYTSAPPFFAFYPPALLFILLYTVFIRKVTPSWRGIMQGLLFFIGLHAFHLIPETANLFSPGSYVNMRVFDRADVKEQIGYFYGVLGIPKISFHFLAYSLTKKLAWVSAIIPFLTIVGLLLNKKKSKTILLTGIFFLLTFYFSTAKITQAGIDLYIKLFYIPGFTMFRNFYGQWQFVFYFFYALLFGQAIFFVFTNLRSTLVKILTLGLIIYFLVSGWKFINGSLVNQVHHQTNVKTFVQLDSQYEETIRFIRSLPADGKILLLPFTDSCYQVIYGENNGAYVGRSTIGQLTGKKDFAGYTDIAPFSDLFWKLGKEKDYESIKRMLGILNVRYIFYNSDPRIFDDTFPGYPYSPDYVRKFLPKDQKGYGEFVKHLASNKVFERGYYALYKIDEKTFIPHFYITKEAILYSDDPNLSVYGKALAFFESLEKGEKKKDVRTVYIEQEICNKLFPEEACHKKSIFKESQIPKIYFVKINPTKYKIKVSNAQKSYMLVFSEAFHKNWKVFVVPSATKSENVTVSYFDGQVEEGMHKNIFFDANTFETTGMKRIPDDNHVIINGYANAWNITPQDTGGKENYELIVEMTGQRIFYVSLALSLIVFLGCVFWGIMLFIKKYFFDIIQRHHG